MHSVIDAKPQSEEIPPSFEQACFTLHPNPLISCLITLSHSRAIGSKRNIEQIPTSAAASGMTRMDPSLALPA